MCRIVLDRSRIHAKRTGKYLGKSLKNLESHLKSYEIQRIVF